MSEQQPASLAYIVIYSHFACRSRHPRRLGCVSLVSPSSMVLPNDAALSSDGQPLSKLAQKVPVARRTGHAQNDEILQRQRAALVWIVDRISKRPAELIPLQSYLVSHDLTQTSNNIASEDAWTGSYRTIDRLPKSFMMTFLLSRAKECNIKTLDSAVLSKLELADSSNIPMLFYMEIQIPGSLTLPDAMQDEQICFQTLRRRAAEVGGRLRAFTEKQGFKTPGKLDFREAGAYKLEFAEDGHATHVTHLVGGKVAIPKHCFVSSEFSLTDNFLDFKAVVSLHPTTHQLCSFFNPSDHTFLNTMYTPGKKWVHLKTMAETLAQHIEEAKSGGSSIDAAAQAAEVVKTATQSRKAKNMEKARQVFVQRQEKRKQIRTIQLT